MSKRMGILGCFKNRSTATSMHSIVTPFWSFIMKLPPLCLAHALLFSFVRAELYVSNQSLPILSEKALFRRADEDYTCSADRECSNGACCGERYRVWDPSSQPNDTNNAIVMYVATVQRTVEMAASRIAMQRPSVASTLKCRAQPVP